MGLPVVLFLIYVKFYDLLMVISMFLDTVTITSILPPGLPFRIHLAPDTNQLGFHDW